jgi:methionine synthase I (cobalamin-dependent)/5,10-methylenetetrahydrofolate reductase
VESVAKSADNSIADSFGVREDGSGQRETGPYREADMQTQTTMGIGQMLAQRVVIADGAMGTMLYQYGAFLNTCFEELNLTNPKLVRQVHDAYIEAGSDFIETNSFGANEIKLAKYGLAEKVVEINTAAVALARQAAGDKALVAGSVGPLGIAHPGVGTDHRRQAIRAFQTQIEALLSAGVDLLVFETFSNPDELIIALTIGREIGNIPVVAQLAVNEHQETAMGYRLQPSMRRIALEPNVVAVGLNCSVGPSAMLECLKQIRTVTDKPISVQPNAGLPRQVEGRMIYMCTPEYMAEYAKRFHEHGARILGGCCGTTPEHIRQIAKAVRGIDRATGQAKIIVHVPSGSDAAAPVRQAAPLAEKSRLGAKLAAGQKVYSIELVPPRGADVRKIEQQAKRCADHGIDAINIPDGPRASSRLSPLVTAVKVQQASGIEPILHVCCRDKNILGLQADMLGAGAMGIHNVLLITGDPPKLGDYPDATAVFDLDSIALTQVVANLNRGLDLAGNSFDGAIALALGVGANPVASDLPREIERYHRKVAAGAEFVITQPVFDPKMLFDFLDAVGDISIPVIAGIWPFTSFKNAEFMANEVPGVVVPRVLLDRMAQAKTQDDGRHLGITIAREMIEALADRVAGFAVSAPFGNVGTALTVLGKVD